MSDKFSQAIYGLSLDSVQWQNKPGTLTYALNCNLQTKDGFSITYGNEYSNFLCVEFPEGYKVIGKHYIPERDEIIFALVKPGDRKSEIGRVKHYNCNGYEVNNTEKECKTCYKGKKLISEVITTDACCEYETIINQDCLEFDETMSHPVRMTHKLTNCGYRLYFTDNNLNLKYLDLDDTVQKDSCGNELTFDCDRIKIFKDFCSPKIVPSEISGGGSLPAGMYQALIAYTDKHGQEYSDYFEATNPVAIFDRTITTQTDYITNKSIRFDITHNTDIFDYFKVVIIKTVNEIPEYIEAGVYRIGITSVLYTNNDPALPRTSLAKIRIGKPVYNKANFIAESSDHLLLADLEGDPDYNFQPFANNMKLFWETVSMPNDKNNSYANGIIVSMFKGYMRDEVYPFGIRFKLKNGKKTKAYHIPNYEAYSFQLTPVANDDVRPDEDCDDVPSFLPRWKVYNTASNLGSSEVSGETYPDKQVCDVRRFQKGEFAYWESTETYPCDERIWGDLAGKPIRHHKFPDSLVTHIHDCFDNENDVNRPTKLPLQTIKDSQYDINHKSFIYPIGVRLDENTFNYWIANTRIFDPQTQDYTIPMTDLICGFELVRGNRVGHKSVHAKGLLYDVAKCTEFDGPNKTKEYFFPNYPYNDLRPDVYLSNNRDIYNSPDPNDTKEESVRLHGFPTNPVTSGEDDFRRFTFHSPDTHFQRSMIGTHLKLETEEFGMQEGHFPSVESHPRYKFLTKFDSTLSALIGTFSGLKIESGLETQATLTASENRTGKISFDYADFTAAATQTYKIIEDIVPRTNFAYMYASRGVYNNYVGVPNDQGKKIRSIEIGRYLSPDNQNIGDTNTIYNFQRESSVYFRVNKAYKKSVSGSVGPFLYDRDDYSRFTLGNNSLDNSWCRKPDKINGSRIRSWYASMKSVVPDQYGTIENIDYVTTGYSVTLDENNQYKPTYYPAFGGDIFINRFSLKRKMPFFTQNMVGRPDDTPFDYDLVPNVGFPNYYIDTSPDELALKEIVDGTTVGLAAVALGAFAASIALPGGGIAASIAALTSTAATSAAAARIFMKMMATMVPKNNLDCDTTPANLDFNSLTDVAGTFSNATLLYQSGKFYLSSYGIPSFFVESDINVDMRHATNDKEHNFYPNVGTGIPDSWLQEKNVPILHDNSYNYNATYSIQNNKEYIESFNNYDFNKLCQSDFPNRVIYSDKSSNEENFDNWLKFGANNYFDFDKSLGKIVSIDSLENNKILVRFENSVQIFNTRITLQSNSPYEIAVSNSGLFAQEPIEFSKTNTGHGGSQHMAFEKTPVGYFWVDAKRGEVFRFKEGLDEISRTNYNWFKEHLPFKILNDFPTINIDNAYKQVGLSLCWDERYERLFLTKLDYELLPEYKGRIEMVEGENFILYDSDTPTQVQLTDARYFSNRSFTISWSPRINNWVSFHSFLPNYYVSLPTHFISGTQTSIWNHNLSSLSYQTYYGTLYPYILEFPISNVPQREMIKSVTVNTDILKYLNETDYYSMNSLNDENYNVFFNKAIIYNKEQCSGVLNLIETPINNSFLRAQYPIHNPDSISILYSKTNKVYSFNTFYDITRNHENQQPIFTNDWDQLQNEYPIDKVINIDSTLYANLAKKVPLISNQTCVRLIQDQYSRYKFINNFEIFQQEPNKNRR